MNMEYNQTFSPDFMDKAEDENDGSNSQQMQLILGCQDEDEEKIIDYDDQAPILISAVSEVDLDDDNEDDDDEIGVRA